MRKSMQYAIQKIEILTFNIRLKKSLIQKNSKMQKLQKMQKMKKTKSGIFSAQKNFLVRKSVFPNCILFRILFCILFRILFIISI